MNTFTRSLLGTFAVLAAALSFAQGVPSAPHLTVTQKSAFLLMNPQVRSQIKLSDSQAAAVGKAISEYGTSQQKLMSAKNPLDREIKAVETGYAKKALAAVDNSQQKKLLAQTIRQIGVQALADKEIAAKVGLTKAQSKKVATQLAKITKRKLAFDEMLAKGLAHVPGDTPAEISKNRNDILKSYDSERLKLKGDLKVLETAVVAGLNGPQRAKWQALQS
ncbi:MAG: hypothetical protein ACAH95_04930 [Fimbriimonas sp.]